MDHALTLVIATLCIFAIAYRYYGLFFVRKVLRADDALPTPSHEFSDGKNYVPTSKWVTAGHHFAAGFDQRPGGSGRRVQQNARGVSRGRAGTGRG